MQIDLLKKGSYWYAVVISIRKLNIVDEKLKISTFRGFVRPCIFLALKDFSPFVCPGRMDV